MSNRVVLPGEKHMTASLWIITSGSPKKVLLVHHKKMNMWFQPGGHVDVYENPIEAVIRETKEETGLDVSYLKDEIAVYDEYAKDLPAPEFFLEERIPAHGDQPEHFHLDMMYVVTLDEQVLTHNEEESHGIGWFTKEEALKLELLENTQALIKKLL